MKAYSQRYEAALTLAAQAHRYQDRKAGDVPYIVHPVHVSTILLCHGFAEDVVIAGLLHDVVEDQDIALDHIEAEFGPIVAELVAAVTEKKLEAGVERPWQVRKQEMLAQIRAASPDAVALKAADALHNARCPGPGPEPVRALDLEQLLARAWAFPLVLPACGRPGSRRAGPASSGR